MHDLDAVLHDFLTQPMVVDIDVTQLSLQRGDLCVDQANRLLVIALNSNSTGIKAYGEFLQ